MSVNFIDPENRENVEKHLRSLGWLETGDSVISVDQAGEGNMNCTLRVKLKSGSCIIKQARPWVEKYPNIAAPVSRADVEATFYSFTSGFEGVSRFMPTLKAFDKTTKTLMIQDLGCAQDFTDLYSSAQAELEILPELCRWLSGLHRIEVSQNECKGFINRDMRALNSQHLFHFPLQNQNGMDLDSITIGLGALAAELIDDQDYVRAVKALAEIYEQDGTELLHGDFYPGSWLRDSKSEKFWIIDPEFCFMGHAEFDIGILLAHLILSGYSVTSALKVFDLYPILPQFEPKLALRFAGVEVMRRVIGVAQLPLESDINKKRELIDFSKKSVLMPSRIF